METIDKTNNMPIEILFDSIFSIYNTVTIFSSGTSQSKRKFNLKIIILFILFGILLLTVSIMLLLDNFDFLPKTKPYKVIMDSILLAACLLLFISSLFHKNRLIKEFRQITGIKIKNISTFISFNLKCQNIDIENLELCKDYCDFLNTRRKDTEASNISSYLFWYALPFLINIISNSIGTDFDKTTTIENIINSFKWGLIGVMIYNLITQIKNKDSTILRIFKYHLDYCILNRKAGKNLTQV